jgi:glycerol-3-phosphate acyltransferase PlsY
MIGLEVLIIIAICILSYFVGCLSTARIVAKGFKNLNIYKIGSGLADSENIYSNVSKTWGVLTAIIDAGKMYVYLQILTLFSLSSFPHIADHIVLFVFGFFMIAGHCLPVTNKFKGGRGIFTYIGLMLVVIPITMLSIVFVAALIVIIFKQIRFVQFMIVLSPPIVCYFIPDFSNKLGIMIAITAFLMGLLNFILSKRLGEF